MYRLLLVLFCLSLFAPARAQDAEALPSVTRILFLLDGSGSMNAPLEKGSANSRMKVAKGLLSHLVDSLEQVPNLELALRVYGHQYDRRLQNCKDSRLEVGFRPDNHVMIQKRLYAVDPKGNTPITYSLEQATSDFPRDPNSRNIIIIITDGIESCGGDPCAMGIALQKKRIFLKPFIIGLSDDKDFAAEFACLGQYFDANNISAFRAALQKVMSQALEDATVSVELLDIDNKPTVTNVNLTFINNVTEEPVYNFIHYLDERGKPDNLDIDAVLSYDLVVNTVPPIVRQDIYFEGGQHNVIRVKAPQGFLEVKQAGTTPYQTPVAVVHQKSVSGPKVNVQPVNTQSRLLVGRYHVEVLTLPRTIFSDVRVAPRETTTLTVPPPGNLNVTNQIAGTGSIYVMRSPTEQEWVYNLQGNSRLNLSLQPGWYKIVFRAGSSRGSRFTDVKTFEITSNNTTNVKLF